METGIGGVKSPKIRGGVKISNFQGPLKLTPFYRVSIENRQFGGQKSKFSRGNFRGEFPPSSVRYVLTPPIPVSDKILLHLSGLTKPMTARENFCPLQGSFAPFGPEVANRVRKWVPGSFRPRGPKCPKRSRKRVKIVGKQSLLTLFRLRFALFGPCGREGPGAHFRTLFATFGPTPGIPNMTAREVTGFYAFFSTRRSGNFLQILGRFLSLLLVYEENPAEKTKDPLKRFQEIECAPKLQISVASRGRSFLNVFSPISLYVSLPLLSLSSMFFFL